MERWKLLPNGHEIEISVERAILIDPLHFCKYTVVCWKINMTPDITRNKQPNLLGRLPRIVSPVSIPISKFFSLVCVSTVDSIKMFIVMTNRDSRRRRRRRPGAICYVSFNIHFTNEMLFVAFWHWSLNFTKLLATRFDYVVQNIIVLVMELGYVFLVLSREGFSKRFGTAN